MKSNKYSKNMQADGIDLLIYAGEYSETVGVRGGPFIFSLTPDEAERMALHLTNAAAALREILDEEQEKPAFLRRQAD